MQPPWGRSLKRRNIQTYRPMDRASYRDATSHLKILKNIKKLLNTVSIFFKESKYLYYFFIKILQKLSNFVIIKYCWSLEHQKQNPIWRWRTVWSKTLYKVKNAMKRNHLSKNMSGEEHYESKPCLEVKNMKKIAV